MALDVPVPDPPALRGPQPRGEYDAIGASTDEQADDYRREEVAEILAAGAWHDGFEEWSAQTSLVPADFELVVEHDLVDQFDFYWDPATDEVGYRAPALPEDVERDLAVGDADEIELELDALGRVVSEMLENDYLPRDDETFGFFDDEAPESEFDAEPESARREEVGEGPTEEPTRDPLGDDTRR